MIDGVKIGPSAGKVKKGPQSIIRLGSRERESPVQGSVKRQSPGLVKFVPAVAYHSFLALPATFTQSGDHFLAEPCKDAVSFLSESRRH